MVDKQMNFRSLVILSGLLMFIGCGVIYNGKYITTKVPNTPRDEFKVGDLVCLGFNNPQMKSRNEWIFKFYIYRNSKKFKEYILIPEEVATRRYYLKENISGSFYTKAQFDSNPNYESVKERLISFLNLIAK
jgi:hypothetical protein